MRGIAMDRRFRGGRRWHARREILLGDGAADGLWFTITTVSSGGVGPSPAAPAVAARGHLLRRRRRRRAVVGGRRAPTHAELTMNAEYLG